MPRIRLAYKIIAVVALTLVALIFLPKQPTITPIFAGDNTTSDPNHPVISFAFNGSATTLSEAFQQAGVSYHPQDRVQVFSADMASGLGGVVSVTQAMPVTIIDGTKTYPTFTWATTVGDLIKEQNISLGDQDKISPTLTTVLNPNETITIVRVAVTKVTQTGPIAFSIVKQDDPTLNKGLTKVKQVGVKGVMQYIYQDTRQNGVTVSHVLLSQSVITAPVSEIDLIGTKPVITVPCAGYDNTVLSAAIANGVDPNLLCKGLMIESNGHANSIGGGQYYGLFQYTQSFWAQASAKAGLAGANWSDPTAQIKVTAWALSHGYTSRWFWAS